MNLKLYTIIYPPIISWQEVIFQRPQQLLLEFVRQGHFAIFTNSIPDGKGVFWYTETGLCIANDLMLTLADPTIKKRLAGTRVVFWVSFPQAMSFKDVVQPDIKVFDYIDESIDEFAFWQQGLREAMDSVDMIIVSSEKLLNLTQADYPHKTYLLKNGADVGHFSKSVRGIPKDLKRIRQRYRRIIGFHGNLDSWIDYSLLREIALSRPQWAMVFIGPENYPEEICRGIPNIYFLGSRPYEILPSYVQNFDVGLIPFQVREMTHSANPIKMYEYLAAGIPVVGTPINECLSFSPMVRIGRDAPEMIQQIEQAIGAKHAEQRIYREAAFANSWSVRINKALEFLDGLA